MVLSSERNSLGETMEPTSTRSRVKLYTLNEERQWDDCGTGHVSWSYAERLITGTSILVRSETDGKMLLETKIQPDICYQKQQDTLIVWSEGDNYDLALSFQERAGCDDIWEKICQVQGKDPSIEITQDIVEESEEERFDEVPEVATPIELPPAEMSRLEDISELVQSCVLSPVHREKLALAVDNAQYIPKLLELFRRCEDLDNLDGLHHLHDVIKNLMLLNKYSLLEVMFKEEALWDVIGCLEYNSLHPQPKRHREFLKKCAHFRQVVTINNAELLAKIHQTYRIQYVQDVILPTPSLFEENMLSTLSSFIFFNKVEIVQMIQEDDKLLNEIFTDLQSSDSSISRRRDLAAFLKEFCSFSQTLQLHSREQFFKTLLSMGILPSIEVCLATDDTSLHSLSLDIFCYIVEYSPPVIREFMMNEMTPKQADQPLLFNILVQLLICDPDPEFGLAGQLLTLLKLLLDPENMIASYQKIEKTEFLSFFYKQCMHLVMRPLLANTADDKILNDEYHMANLQSLIIDLLTYCVEHHTYHIRNYILNKDILRKVLVLMQSKHKFLVLASLRFLRKMIGLKDEFYNRYIVRNKLLLPVVEGFKCNANRYNMINSAMIELFEFIRQDDIKSLVTHIVDTYHEVFNDVDYVQTFKGLKIRYDQQKERLDNSTCLNNSSGYSRVAATSRFRRDARTLDDEEELWFESEDDDVSLGNTTDAELKQPPKSDSPAPHSMAFMSKDYEERESGVAIATLGDNPNSPTCPGPNSPGSTKPSSPAASNCLTGTDSPLASSTSSPTANGLVKERKRKRLVDYGPMSDSDDDEEQDDIVDEEHSGSGDSPNMKRNRLS